MERIIKVTGKGKISVTPDTVRLIITQTGIDKEHAEAIQKSAKYKSYLNTVLEKVGFAKEDLKTLYFNINTEYDSYHDKDGNWKREFKGYKFTHRMKLEFPVDSVALGKVLTAIALCPGDLEFSINYTISDPEAAKNELLAKAVEDSRAKAEILSKAAGVSLKDIVTIDYSWGEIEFVTRPVNDLMMKKGVCAMAEYEDEIELDIEADDIDVTDTVTVMWEIG